MGDGVSVGDVVWSTKQESALCVHSNLTDVPQFFLMLMFSLSAACHLLSEMVTGAVVFFLALCLFAAYQNKYDLIRIKYGHVCLPHNTYRVLTASICHGIEIWVPPGHSLGPRFCSSWAAESHYGLMIWAAMLTSVTLDGFSCDRGVLHHRHFSKHLFFSVLAFIIGTSLHIFAWSFCRSLL